MNNDWKYFKPGDKIKRINYDYFAIKKGEIYTFAKYTNHDSQVTLFVKEIGDGSYYDSDKFIKVDLDIFNNLGD